MAEPLTPAHGAAAGEEGTLAPRNCGEIISRARNLPAASRTSFQKVSSWGVRS